MPRRRRKFVFVLAVGTVFFLPAAHASGAAPDPQSPAEKSGAKQTPQQKTPSPEEELQQAIDNAGNDRAALVRNLEAFLKKYPESPQRVRTYRALVESSLQLRDTPRA